MNNLSIAPINTNDIAEVEFICLRHIETPALWIENYSFSEEELNEIRTDFLKAIDRNILFGLTAKTEKGIIGFIWAELLPKRPDVAEIFSLWISPEFRKKGIATELKNKIEKIAIDRGVKKIRTNVYSSNKTMLDFNLKLGYKITRYDLEKEL